MMLAAARMLIAGGLVVIAKPPRAVYGLKNTLLYVHVGGRMHCSVTSVLRRSLSRVRLLKLPQLDVLRYLAVPGFKD